MDIVKQIGYSMSLHDPQKEALSYLHNISSQIEYKTAPKTESEAVASAHCESKRQIKVADEFSFPSFCFEMATGIGKTRLMGASIYYLYKTKGYRHFFILTPGDTIYEKLKKESRPEHPKYLFKGLEAELGARPKVYDGENYLQYNQLEFEKHHEIQLFIFNIGKIFTRGDVTFKFHRYQETLGKSFADILAGFDDLVICMDEAHRYYAPASMKAIDYLKPVLGLEFTATPKNNKNVIYAYDLAKGAGKFLKIPVMNGRTNLAGYNAADVQEMKLLDGMRLHENRKRVLYKYCADNNLEYVKPIVLVSCKDTEHAKEVRAIIDSDDFCEGRYKNKVIEIHSGSGSAEAEENIAKLLTVESSRNPVEIVLHVYKLKEGWDVNNLFTIIPLNAAKSEILAMQTIGRGLRLPFGYITGNPELDTLDIVAHDHYREIVEDLKANPIFRTRDLDKNDIEPTKTVVITPGFDDRQLTFLDEYFTGHQIKRVQDITDPYEQAKIYEAYVRSVSAKPVKKEENTPQPTLFDMLDETTGEVTVPVAAVHSGHTLSSVVIPTKEEFIKKLSRMTATCISVPRILISPSTTMSIAEPIIIKRNIKDFAIESSKVERYDVVNNTLLETFDAAILEDPNPINTLACMLLDAVSELDSNDAGIVLDVVNQYLSQIEGDVQEKRKIVRRYAMLILEDIKKQVLAAIKTDTKIIYAVQKDLIVFGKTVKVTKSDGGEISLYKDIPDKKNIRRYAFTGFKKSYYEKYGFESDDERRFAVILEEDKDVIRWIKPPQNQMGIFYKPGSQYNPDFLVETATDKYVIEVKDSDSLKDPDVLLKKHEGEEWCKYASISDADSKKWHYRLIAGDKIQTGNSLRVILAFADDAK